MTKILFLAALTSLSVAQAAETFPAIGCTNVDGQWKKGDLVTISLASFTIDANRQQRPTRVSTLHHYAGNTRSYKKTALASVMVSNTPDRMPVPYTFEFLDRSENADGSALVISMPRDRRGNTISAAAKYYPNTASDDFLEFYCQANRGDRPPGPGVGGRN